MDNLVLTNRGNRILSSGNKDNSIKVWDLSEKRQIFDLNQDLMEHGVTSDWVSAITISSDDKILVSGSVDGSICIWDMEERVLKHTLIRAHDGNSGRFSHP